GGAAVLSGATGPGARRARAQEAGPGRSGLRAMPLARRGGRVGLAGAARRYPYVEAAFWRSRCRRCAVVTCGIGAVRERLDRRAWGVAGALPVVSTTAVTASKAGAMASEAMASQAWAMASKAGSMSPRDGPAAPRRPLRVSVMENACSAGISRRARRGVLPNARFWGDQAGV